MLLLDNRR